MVIERERLRLARKYALLEHAVLYSLVLSPALPGNGERAALCTLCEFYTTGRLQSAKLVESTPETLTHL